MIRPRVLRFQVFLLAVTSLGVVGGTILMPINPAIAIAGKTVGGDAPITEWTWRSLPAPTVTALPPRGQEWELSRYQAYQDLLAGHTIGETFSRTSAFLDLVAAAARKTAATAGPPDK